MTAFEQFVKDFRNEYGRTPTTKDFETLITPHLVRKLKRDDFDGRSTNGTYQTKRRK